MKLRPYRLQLPENTSTGAVLGPGELTPDDFDIDLLNLSSVSLLLHVVRLSNSGPATGATLHFGVSTFDTPRVGPSGDPLMDPIRQNGPVEDILSVRYTTTSPPPTGEFAIPTTFPVFHRRVSVQRDWSVNSQDTSLPEGNPPLARYVTGWAFITTPGTVGTYEFSWAHEITVIAR